MRNAQQKISTPKLLIVDIWGGQVIPSLHPLSSRLSSRLSSGLSNQSAGAAVLDRFPLALPKKETSKKASLSMAEFEKLTKLLTDAGELSIIFGCLEDPFFPFEGKFDLSLKALELIALAKPKRIIVQTRSPLAVLALPLLKSLGERVVVRVAFEAASDSLQETHFPSLPRISERMKFVRALINLGISTELQLSPIVGQSDRASNFEKFVSDSAAPLHLRSLADLIGADPERMAHTPTKQLLIQSDRFLERLAKAHPERVVSSDLPVNQETLAA